MNVAISLIRTACRLIQWEELWVEYPHLPELEDVDWADYDECRYEDA